MTNLNPLNQISCITHKTIKKNATEINILNY